MSSKPYRPNRLDVIDETFDGEAVIVNLVTGMYFSLTPAATELWALLADGRSVESLAASTNAPPEAITQFIEQLQAESLLVDADADAGPAATTVEIDGEPKLERFTDMQDLLMLDPIHDINLDGDGWPVAAQQ